MPRLRLLVYNGTFFLVCLLAFLLIFESKLHIPAWVQVGGRMHPLLLHFPITLLVLYGLWYLITPRPSNDASHQPQADDILLLGAFTAVATALMGLVLSLEDGYDQEALFWHKWTGVATAFVGFGWYSFRGRLARRPVVARTFSGLALGVLLFTGHLGSSLTHGEEFLLAPVLSDEQPALVAFDEALVYDHVVWPILEEKCISCHNPQKAKGELVMTTAALLARGGKNGVPWDTTQPDLGLLLRRAHLPLDDKKHMPPRGKAQLTDDEVQILESWIRRGSSFTARVVEFPTEDPLFRFASNRLGTSQAEENYDFAAADEATIQKLTTNYRVITPLAEESPALMVSFFSAAAFKSSDLNELTPIKEQIVELDLSKMPVKDEDLKTIAQFTNLRKLLLNFTDITGQTLNELAGLPHLRDLSLTGTPVTATQLRALKKNESLSTLYLWNTGVQPAEFTALRTELKGITLVSGFRSDTVVLKLNPPQIENKDQILTGPVPVTLKHQIKGAVIRYTLDGSDPDSVLSPIYKEGIVIAENAKLRARAYKPGWYGSDITGRQFYRTTYRPDSVQLLTTPAPQYNGQAGKVLRDGIKSNGDFKNGKWVGIREGPLVGLLRFEKPVNSRKVSVSMLQNVGASIFPPVRVEVWGGMEPEKLKLLGSQKLAVPAEKDPRNEDKLYEFSYEPTTVKYIKVVAVPLAKLPAWHSSKGEPAWVFMDEVLVN
jgi:hypothetical protein